VTAFHHFPPLAAREPDAESGPAATDPVADIRVSQHAASMNSLYPARRIPQGMVVIGFVFVTCSLAIGVAHYGFGVPVYNRNTGEPSSDGSIGLLLAAFAGVGLLLALLGRVILRASARHTLAGPQARNVR
jgi:hypothetical protein